MIKISLALAASAIFLSACAELHASVDTTSLAAFSMPLSYDYQNSTSERYFRKVYQSAEDKEGERNRITFELMSVVDGNYDAFERKLRDSKGYKDSFVDIFSLILTGSASIASGGTPKVLAAIDTGFKGGNSALDKNLLGAQVPVLIINKMRSNRANIAKEIFAGISRKVDDYPLEASLRDVLRYYSEGSVSSALTSLVGSTAKLADESASQADDAKHKIEVSSLKATK